MILTKVKVYLSHSCFAVESRLHLGLLFNKNVVSFPCIPLISLPLSFLPSFLLLLLLLLLLLIIIIIIIIIIIVLYYYYYYYYYYYRLTQLFIIMIIIIMMMMMMIIIIKNIITLFSVFLLFYSNRWDLLLL